MLLFHSKPKFAARADCNHAKYFLTEVCVFVCTDFSLTHTYIYIHMGSKCSHIKFAVDRIVRTHKLFCPEKSQVEKTSQMTKKKKKVTTNVVTNTY